MIRRVILLLFAVLGLTLAPGSVSAQRDSSSLEGSWALRLDGAIVFRFDLARDGAGWSGRWTRPRSFATDGNRFSHLVGATTLKAEKGGTIGEWAELTFADNRPGAVPDVFRFRLVGKDKAELIYAGTGLAPYTLDRVAGDALLGPFEEGKIYRRPGLAAAASTRLPPASPERETQGPPAMEGR